MHTIDHDFISMIGLLANAAVGNNVITENYNEKKVLQFAKEQSVLPLVCSALGAAGGDYEKYVVGAAGKNISDLSYIRCIMDELDSNNIEYVILKGESIAYLYKEPELRISGDVDLLVDKADEEKTLRVFSEFGYNYKKRPDWVNETELYHPVGKMAEVHVGLYDESREDIFFGKAGEITEPYMSITTNNLGKIKVLSPNDGIMFLYLHFVKHFLSSGAGIRQLLDVVVYSSYYKDVIKWDVFFRKLDKIHYLQLYSYLLSAAVKYMGFKKENLPKVDYDFDKADIVLSDLQHCGIFGHNEADLARFKTAYEKKRNEKYGFVNYDEYQKKYNVSKFSLLFPSPGFMKIKYPYLIRRPYLLPFAWLNRIFNAVAKRIKKLKPKANHRSENDAVTDRMKMMEELDII